MTEAVFDTRGVKIALINAVGMFNEFLGQSLDTQRYQSWASTIQQIKATGANSVTLIVSGGVMNKASDNQFNPALKSSPDEAVVRGLVNLIQAAGMEVAINVFFTVDKVIAGDPGSAGADRPYPTDKSAWVASASQPILQWARFAQEVGASAYIPFSDETQHLLADSSLTSQWLQLIGQIRDAYSGELTTTWWTPGYGDSITRIPTAIISALDTLGLGVFPNLTFDTNASIDALTAAYHSDAAGNDVLVFLQGLSELYGKKIWITDKAFHSFDGAAADEGRIFNNSIPLSPDADEQARLYESFLRAMSRESGEWLDGVSFQSFNNMIDGRVETARFLDGPLSESPQGKPAEAVLTAWFQGARQGVGVEKADGIQASRLLGGYHHDRLSGGLGNDALIGGAGDDVLTGGPASAVSASVYEVKLLLRGVTAAGVPPVVQVLDAAGAVAASATITAPYTFPAIGPATEVVFRLNSLDGFLLRMKNWAFIDASTTGNRLVHVEAASVNGVKVDLAQRLVYDPPTPYGDMPGHLDGYHGGDFRFNLKGLGVAPNSAFIGDNDTLDAGPGQDTLIGGAGNDQLDGGPGIDLAKYDGPRSAYSVSDQGAGAWSVRAADGSTDQLIGVERLQFADRKLALDLDDHAGTVAKVLGAVFGPAAVGNREYAGIGLNLLDGGMAIDQLMNLALNVRLGAGASATELVTVLYTNVVGNGPTSAELAAFVGLLDQGQITRTGLGILAAETSLNAALIGLANLGATGLEYL